MLQSAIPAPLVLRKTIISPKHQNTVSGCLERCQFSITLLWPRLWMVAGIEKRFKFFQPLIPEDPHYLLAPFIAVHDWRVHGKLGQAYSDQQTRAPERWNTSDQPGKGCSYRVRQAGHQAKRSERWETTVPATGRRSGLFPALVGVSTARLASVIGRYERNDRVADTLFTPAATSGGLRR